MASSEATTSNSEEKSENKSEEAFNEFYSEVRTILVGCRLDFNTFFLISLAITSGNLDISFWV